MFTVTLSDGRVVPMYGREHAVARLAELHPPGCICPVHYFAPFGGACGVLGTCPIHRPRP